MSLDITNDDDDKKQRQPMTVFKETYKVDSASTSSDYKTTKFGTTLAILNTWHRLINMILTGKT